MSPDPSAIALVLKRQAARRSQSAGAAFESLVRATLIRHGYSHVCRIETGMRKLAGKWMHCAHVAGDWRAVGHQGRSVLVEAKWRPDGLVYSDLTRGQVTALTEHMLAGGESLVAWGHRGGIELLYWSQLRMHGFGHRARLTDEMVKAGRVG